MDSFATQPDPADTTQPQVQPMTHPDEDQSEPAQGGVVSSQVLHDFVVKLVNENTSVVDEEVRNQLVADMEDQVEQLIEAKIVEAMPAAQYEAFEQLLNKQASAEEVQTFVKQYVPDLDEVIARALFEFHQAYQKPVEE